MKTLSCKDLGDTCEFVAKGETEDEVVQKMKEHAMEHHKEKVDDMLKTMSEKEMEDMLRGKIREE